MDRGDDLREFVRLAPLAVCLTGRDDGRILDVSPAFERLVGRTRDSMLGHSTLALGIIDADVRASALSQLGIQRDPLAMTLRHADGSVRDVRGWSAPLTVDGATCLLSYFDDVTERRAMEASLTRERELHAALLHAQSDAGQAIHITDVTTNRAVYVNDALRKLYGIPDDAPLSSNVWDRLPPAERERLRERARNRDPNDPGPTISELTALKHDGTPIPVEVVVQRFTLDGRPHILSIVRDLTQRKAAEQALRDSVLTRAFARRLLTGLLQKGRVSEEVVREMGRQLARETGTTDLEGSLAAFLGMGMGKLRLDKSEGKSFRFAGTDLIEIQPGASQTTCYLTLSFLEGAVSRSRGGIALGTETRCQSRGDPECVFMVVAR